MPVRKTKVEIEGSKFKINGEFINKGRVWNGIEIEGLLFNTRMVQGIFDDKNPETVSKWAYPDTGKWDPDRNTKEFIDAMPLWQSKGVLGFTINLQGGSPEGYSREQPWINSAFLEDGSLDEKYMARLEKILDRADELGMVPIVGYFYFGQSKSIRDEQAVVDGVKNATMWILKKGYTNVLIEIANECDINDLSERDRMDYYLQDNLKSKNIHNLIKLVQSMEYEGRRLLASTSFRGGGIPTDNVVEVADFILIHGNGVEDVKRIKEMIDIIRQKPCYRGQPILFNEDDHFDFDKDKNHLLTAIRNGVSWGYFDPGKSNYCDGYQRPPVNWGINTQRKKEFFDLVEKIVGKRI